MLMERWEMYQTVNLVYKKFSINSVYISDLTEMLYEMQKLVENLQEYFEQKKQEKIQRNEYVGYYDRDLNFVRDVAVGKSTIMGRVKKYCDKCFFYISKDYYLDALSYLKAIQKMMFRLRTTLEKEQNDTVSR